MRPKSFQGEPWPGGVLLTEKMGTVEGAHHRKPVGIRGGSGARRLLCVVCAAAGPTAAGGQEGVRVSCWRGLLGGLREQGHSVAFEQNTGKRMDPGVAGTE